MLSVFGISLKSCVPVTKSAIHFICIKNVKDILASLPFPKDFKYSGETGERQRKYFLYQSAALINFYQLHIFIAAASSKAMPSIEIVL